MTQAKNVMNSIPLDRSTIRSIEYGVKVSVCDRKRESMAKMVLFFFLSGSQSDYVLYVPFLLFFCGIRADLY